MYSIVCVVCDVNIFMGVVGNIFRFEWMMKICWVIFRVRKFDVFILVMNGYFLLLVIRDDYIVGYVVNYVERV